MKLELEKQRIRYCFNRAKHTYDQHCQTQSKVGETLINCLQQYKKNFNHILDLGCGTGLVTQNLAAALQYKEFMAIDIAEHLLKIADVRLRNWGVKVCLADFDRTPCGENKFDLVFSNMALQWSLNIENSLQEINRIMQPNGYLICSLPIKGTFQEMKNRLYQLSGEEYFNDFFDLHELSDKITNAGYALLEQKVDCHATNFSSFFEMLYSIKHVGANYKKQKINGIKLQRKFLTQIEQKNIALTYKIALIIAKKQP